MDVHRHELGAGALWRAGHGRLYGAFNYTPEKDVARAPMRVDALPYRVEQLTWAFTDMTVTGGRMAIMWDKTMGSVPFSLGR